MSSKRILFSGFSIVTGSLLLVASGCAGKSYERAEARVESINGVRATLSQGKSQISTVLTSLDQVSMNAKTDPRPAFDKLTADIEALDALREDARKRAEAMRERTKEYLAAWEQEMAGVKNPDLARLSETQRAKAKSEFEKLKSQGDALKAAYEAFSTDLHELHKFLGNQLNATGIASASKVTSKVKTSGQKVNKEIDSFSSALTTVAEAIRVALPPPEAGTAPTSAK
jgi:chromosome segregation ATPase